MTNPYRKEGSAPEPPDKQNLERSRIRRRYPLSALGLFVEAAGPVNRAMGPAFWSLLVTFFFVLADPYRRVHLIFRLLLTLLTWPMAKRVGGWIWKQVEHTVS